MSASPSTSRGPSRHRQRASTASNNRRSRPISVLGRKKTVSSNDAYLYALRVAFLSYLLHPRHRRGNSITANGLAGAPPKPQHQSTFHELMKDFTLSTTTSKSSTFPKGFISELEKRITKVLYGKEQRREYQDATVKRTFAAFFNALTEASFRKRMEKDRRVEDLVLIFFSNATKELSKGQSSDDTSWKLLVDRHVALFVRLISLTIADHDWIRDRAELVGKLSSLEKKLLHHEGDLADRRQSQGSGVEQPQIDYDVSNMTMVQTVAKVFGLRNSVVQSDINKFKDTWTTKEAIQDLKKYQAQLSLGAKHTLSPDDFESPDAFEAWRKSEINAISRMMLALVQSNPDLSNSSSTSGALSILNDADPSSPLQASATPMDDSVESMTLLSLSDDMYTFIPPGPRDYYRSILAEVITYETNQRVSDPDQQGTEITAARLLSKHTSELLSEICSRWRIPVFSRSVLFLDVFKEKFIVQEIDLDTLDAAFSFVNEPLSEKKNSRNEMIAVSYREGRDKWITLDKMLLINILNGLHETLLRQLYETFLHCYEVKKHPLGPVMMVLETWIYEDPLFQQDDVSQQAFTENLNAGLLAKAKDAYDALLTSELPSDSQVWEFYHVIQLGGKVMKLCDRIQKRYRKNPVIMGVNPSKILFSVVLPKYAGDAHSVIQNIIETAKQNGTQVDIEDGFSLYNELKLIRSAYKAALPDQEFPFDVEQTLEEFVWRWIKMSDEKVSGWVEQAIKQDSFKLPEGSENLNTEDRSTSSVKDIFRSMTQLVSQIVDLRWEDQVTNAKFMTAISKSIGNGLAKYCEILENDFAREMDRLTPEQEAAITQTRQEKWMQMAKDALKEKEKVEPFSFFPESFVRLNNIMYALHNLDILERTVDADHCAEILQKYAAPFIKKQKKATSYVFTVKIVEAEDLKACDLNGLSDPYVVLADEYQRRLLKTRVVTNSLNPRWEDSVDITTGGPLNIFATVWDWDAVGDHDFIGRTSLKLDPSFFQDLGPQEYWLDLDTQGRLLIRVNMEGERDDIQFYFAKAFRTLKRTQRDMTRKITDKLSAYIEHILSRRALKQLQSTKLSVTVSNYFSRNKAPSQTGPTTQDIEAALDPLFAYFNENFRIMQETLTQEAMIQVMTRLWKEVLSTIESLMVPPLSDKPSNQRPLTPQDLDVVSQWLSMLLSFFNAVDEETGESFGVPMDILKSPKYHEIQNLFFFYFEPTEDLIRTSERMASVTMQKQQNSRNHMSSLSAAGSSLGVPFSNGLPHRGKSIMLSRNLGTMRKAKEEKWREAQAEPNDDMILRILRMRPEAVSYLRERSRQKARLVITTTANMFIKHSLMSSAGVGRMG
ncbi:hypothetical protein KEM54_004278 [Ascosphaera aggregata]|nr:hypothetical protein KEM54_004278 [Ascosphaera aggregata]